MLNTIGSAVFFFLPFLLTVSSARAFDTNPYVAIGITAVLLHPDTSAQMTAAEQPYFLGIPITQTQYTSSVIPVILMVWVMGKVAGLVKRLLPPLLHTVLVPTLMIIAGLLALLVVGPVGNIVAAVLGVVVSWLNGVAPWLVPTMIGAFGALLISVGASFTLFPLALARSPSSVTTPSTARASWRCEPVVDRGEPGCGPKGSQPHLQSLRSVCGVDRGDGGSQPSLYGVAIPLGRPLIATCLGGFVGGLIAGLSGFKVYGFLPSGLAAVPLSWGPTGPPTSSGGWW